MSMKRRSFFTFGLTIMIAVMISSCGFHLRGTTSQAHLPFKTLYVNLADSSPLGMELIRNIRAGGETTVVTDPKAAQAIVEVLSESKEKAILSLNSQGRVREYTLYYRLLFRVKDAQDKELLAPTTIALKRNISFNESQVIAKEKEEDLLYRDMQTDLVQQILRRLAAIKPV